jgi:hypothetical protein
MPCVVKERAEKVLVAPTRPLPKRELIGSIAMTAKTPDTYHICDSATAKIVANRCTMCGGDGFVLRPVLDACPRCAVIAEADWRMLRRRAA